MYECLHDTYAKIAFFTVLVYPSVLANLLKRLDRRLRDLYWQVTDYLRSNLGYFFASFAQLVNK